MAIPQDWPAADGELVISPRGGSICAFAGGRGLLRSRKRRETVSCAGLEALGIAWHDLAAGRGAGIVLRAGRLGADGSGEKVAADRVCRRSGEADEVG